MVDMDFDAIIFALQSGKGDLGVAGMTNTPERAQTVDFSINYVDTNQMIIVPEGSDITGPEGLAGKTIGVQMGTTGDLFVTDNIEGANVQRYKTGPDAGAELAAGKLDAVVIDAGPAAQIAGANAGLMVLETPATPEPEQYAIAIAKGEEDLKAVVDSVLEKLIADGQVSLDRRIQRDLQPGVCRVTLLTPSNEDPTGRNRGNNLSSVSVVPSNA